MDVAGQSEVFEGRFVTLAGGRRALIRRLRPDDDRLFPAFDRRVTDDDRRLRFFANLDEMPDRMIWDLTHFDRHVADAVIALDPSGEAMLGVARVHGAASGSAGSEARDGEFALLVRSDLKGRGLGRALMRALTLRAQRLGLVSMHGLVLRENRRMIAFAREMGFAIQPVADDPGLVRAAIRLLSGAGGLDRVGRPVALRDGAVHATAG